jgi:polyhydroxyalkanoate synthase subunit PhaC
MTAPLRRRGPRPLPLHLMLGAGRGMLAIGAMTPPGAWPSWSDAWPISKAARREAGRIRERLAAGHHAPEAFRAAVLRRLLREDRALLAGIAAYRRHPYARDLPDPPSLWAEGGSRLLDFGAAGAAGPPVVFVPSLVNRAYVLDLAPGASMLRWLAGQGVRPVLLDWGWPGEAERAFTLTDYVAGRLERALMALGQPVVLVGYCMGGLLALAAALRRPDLVSALGLLATPWDFCASPEEVARGAAAAALLPGLEPILAATGTLPVDVIQTLFAGLDPWGIPRKFRAFARLDPASPRAEQFVALEDWLNDGVPLAAPVAREALGGWYGGRAASARLRRDPAPGPHRPPGVRDSARRTPAGRNGA